MEALEARSIFVSMLPQPGRAKARLVAVINHFNEIAQNSG